MFKRLTKSPGPLLFGAMLAFSTGGFSQNLDLSGNGVSDVWELIYGASSAAPNADPDNDGIINAQEATAGTNPFDAGSVPSISLYSRSATNFSVTLWSALGKQYRLLSVTNLNSTNWVTDATAIPRSGTVVSLAAPANEETRFFRVVLSDVDSDGDGLNDWEEYKLGLDPLSSSSSAFLDENGAIPGDYNYAASRLAEHNRISIAAADPTAVQPGVGETATSLGAITVSRAGFPLDSVTVNLALGGPGTGYAVEGVDHAFLTRPVTLPAGSSYQTITVTPLANTNLAAPVIATMKLLPGANYSVSSSSNATVVIYPSEVPRGAGLTGYYFTNSSTTYSNSANFNPANLFLTRVDTNINFIWGPAVSPNLSNGFYTVRWVGQVQPQYTETYVFNTRSDDGVKLWVNDQLLIDRWQTQSATDWTNIIALQAGVKYNIKLEYLQRGSSGSVRLYWYSPSQAKQIIPTERLYPVVSGAPSAIVSSLEAVGFVGQPFSFNVAGANSPVGYTATGVPAGLSFNTTNGLISGTPLIAGDFQVSLVASNGIGTGASVVNLRIFETAGAAVSREVWTNVAGTSISSIPVNAPAHSTMALGGLEGITDFGDNYAERIRGFFVAPVTDNYYFWIAGSDSAELWISNDDEPVNKVRRATVSGTGARQWTSGPGQRSPWLTLVAGQRYYIEILHKAGAGSGDNWSVGWRRDSTGTNTEPSGLMPSHLLSRYFAPPPSIIPGTLYSANMLAQGTALSSAVGSATLRVNTEGTRAVLKYSHSELTTPKTAAHIHADTYKNKNPQGQIIFDIDAAIPEPDGSLVWDIVPSGALSAADIVEIIKEGKAYINIHSAMYPNGEINGHFTLAEGSQTFTPPPPPLVWTNEPMTSNAIARFLIQSTFGPTPAEFAQVQALGYEGWIDNQFVLPIGRHLSNVLVTASSDPSSPYSDEQTYNTWWMQSVTAPDQLRQRVAFALSEILVVSANGVLDENSRALSSYYDTLLEHSFGNFRELLEAVTLSPAMGLYLDMRRNEKGNIILGTHPNENYAREILQLFSIGLNRMWPDGTLILNSDGNLIPTYTQEEILGFSRVFTGWNYWQVNPTNSSRLPFNWSPSANYTNPMVLVPYRHELGTKLLLDNVMLPQAHGNQLVSGTIEFDNYGLTDLELAHDSIFLNENVGPYICRQLIQRLVTSHPSRDYLYRVVQKFNDNGSGVRGDMKAVVKAILLDYDARSTNTLSLPTFGKQREPLLRVTAAARAFPAPPANSGTYSQNGNHLLTVTTATPHRLNNNDDVFCGFTDTSGQRVPPSQPYSNVQVTSPNSFTVTAPGFSSATYGQSGTVITITNSGHGLGVGSMLHLTFTSGGAANGVFQVASVPSTSRFTVTAADSATRVGSCFFPKITGGGFLVQNNTNLTVITPFEHGLQAGQGVYVIFNQAGDPPDGQYSVNSVPDPSRFAIVVPSTGNRTDNGQTTLPLVALSAVRSGDAVVRFSTWQMNATDTGSSSALSQTPLNSPTVFNFFFPDYKFPGLLASAGLTTPEFQLTSDTEAILQMNFLTGGILSGTSANTNGLLSFNSGNGSIMMDIGPWMTTNYTSNADIPALVDSLNTLICAGQLSSGAKTNIVSYVANTTNFSYSTPPTQNQMRDRVRAVVHLILSSPDFVIQK